MKSDRELLYKTATQLKRWAEDPGTSGYQHEPMDILANQIFEHLDAIQPTVQTDGLKTCHYKPRGGACDYAPVGPSCGQCDYYYTAT